MRIGVDLRYLSHGLVGGVRTYAYHLARKLPPLAGGDELVYYVDAKAPFELPDVPDHVRVRTLPWTSGASSVVNDLRIRHWMERDGVEAAHFPANYGPRGSYALIVTVHDALNLFPMAQHWRGFGKTPRHVAMMAYLGWKTRRALRQADALITISEHARAEIVRMSGCCPERLTVIHSAASDEFRVIADAAVLQAARDRWMRRTHLILADGIKNPGPLIDAFATLPATVRAATELVFFSREPAPRTKVAAALADPAVRFVPRPATEDLVALMNVATVFVFPSFYEGFGLPLVEAMSCGAPIIASSRGSIPEVLGGAGLVFDLERPGDLGGQLRAVLESGAMQGELRTKSLDRSRDFSWRRTAERTLAVYRSATARRGPQNRP